MQSSILCQECGGDTILRLRICCCVWGGIGGAPRETCKTSTSGLLVGHRLHAVLTSISGTSAHIPSTVWHSRTQRRTCLPTPSLTHCQTRHAGWCCRRLHNRHGFSRLFHVCHKCSAWTCSHLWREPSSDGGPATSGVLWWRHFAEHSSHGRNLAWKDNSNLHILTFFFSKQYFYFFTL